MKGARYLKYALGEIVLVVIGILIALSINNWNQRRLAGQEEQKLLANIKVDFEKAVKTFNRLNQRRDESITNFQALIDVAQSGDYTNTVHIDSLLGKSIFTPTYNGGSSSLSILINSGKINLLKNEELKSLLFYWPQAVEDMTEGEQDAKKLTLDRWVPFMAQYTSSNDWFKNVDFEGLPFKKRKSEVSKNYAALFASREFENYIVMMELLYINGRIETNRLIKSADRIIDIISTKLPKD